MANIGSREEGSGNVFADLGLPDADARLAPSEPGFHVDQLLAARKLTQREIASLLGIRQPDVFHRMNGHFISTASPQTSCSTSLAEAA